MDNKTAIEYLQRRINPQESYDDLLSFPRFIEIETVNACNARCPMCTIADWQRKSPTMKDDLFRRIADEIIEHRDEVIRVSLYRDGEPLLDKKLPDRIAYLKDGGINATSISTNVSLLNEERARSAAPNWNNCPAS
jgi:MoaA/NifB/PqqE/SkfB family radical SAM enzyme